MQFNGHRLITRLTLLTITPVLLTLSVSAQQPQNAAPEEVVWVNTDLVQSAITVVDSNKPAGVISTVKAIYAKKRPR